VPEHAESEALVGILEPLHDAVVGPGDRPQPLADPADALVVVRLHRRVLTEQGAQAALLRDGDAVIREEARLVAVPLVADLLRQVLDEVAPARHVQQLRAAADRQHGHVPRERALQERQLRAVAPRLRRVRRRVRVGAVQTGVEIAAAREDHAVQAVERLRHGSVHRGDHDGPSARGLDRVNVRHRDERRLLGPDAHLYPLGVRGDADERPHARSKFRSRS
jgi:hypothetical protein